MLDAVRKIADCLNGADLSRVRVDASETEIARHLSAALRQRFNEIERVRVTGIDGSVRNPDFAVRVTDASGSPRRVALEYKLYRSRHQGAGEMDRGLGQCIAYAEQYDASLLVVVYLVPPEHRIAQHWAELSTPLWVERAGRRVPLHLVTVFRTAAGGQGADEPTPEEIERAIAAACSDDANAD
jgi:hypothetical protein